MVECPQAKKFAESIFGPIVQKAMVPEEFLNASIDMFEDGAYDEYDACEGYEILVSFIGGNTVSLGEGLNGFRIERV